VRNLRAFARVHVPGVRSLPAVEVAIASILAPSLGSPNPFLAPAGVAPEDRWDQIDKPSIAYWRDHTVIVLALSPADSDACTGTARPINRFNLECRPFLPRRLAQIGATI